MVLGANDKFNIEKIITNLDNNSTTEIHGCEINNLNYISSYSLSDRTRSFMKIQDGCDYSCSYCTIPLARGKNRSDSIENIIKNAEDIANNGIKEIVITGVNIGTYKDPTNMKTLTDLLLELEKVKGINRYRISSIEPNLITNEIINLVKNSNKFMPHFHIPLQSGSNNILKKMRRRYQRELYAEKINKIYKEVQDVCIGADVIVGFPGETDVEFHETLNFIKSLPISYLHVFSYSERENTKALLLPNPVPKELKKTRSKQIRILSNKLQQKFYRKQINKNYNVLFEEEKDGMILGFTDNYIRVKVKNNSDICNTVKKVQLSNISSDGIMKANII